MQRLRWFLIGIALTTFSADYIYMKAHWREMEFVSVKAMAVAERSQANSTACLIDLAYNRSLIESWAEKRRIITLAQVEALQSIDRAREGDAEALATLSDLGYSVTKPNNRLVAILPPIRGKGIGGY